MASILSIHKSEQDRIARGLHRNIHRFLDKVKCHVAIIDEEIRQLEAIDMRRQMDEIITNASKDLLDSTMQVIPDIVKTEGLYFGILHLVDKIKIAHQLEVKTNLIQIDLPTTLAETIYRIIDDQLHLYLATEGLRKVSIQVSENLKFINLRLRGQFTTTSIKADTYFELKTKKRIESRTKFINAVVTEIDEEKMHGCHVLIPKP